LPIDFGSQGVRMIRGTLTPSSKFCNTIAV
jgi:hypothetical protein